MDYELTRYAERTGDVIRFNKETRNAFLNFATSAEARWDANFRDLNGAIIRLCTLALGGRITIDILNEEILRLKSLWGSEKFNWKDDITEKYGVLIDFEKFDLFDRIQLKGVLKVCSESKNLSDAGRKLFALSRLEKVSSNDSDRLKKYLAKFNLTWEMI